MAIFSIFHSFLLVHQRVYPINIPLNHYKIPLNHYKIPLNHYKIPLNHYKIPLNHYKSPLIAHSPSVFKGGSCSPWTSRWDLYPDPRLHSSSSRPDLPRCPWRPGRCSGSVFFRENLQENMGLSENVGYIPNEIAI